MSEPGHAVPGPAGEAQRPPVGRAGKLRGLTGERVTSVDVARRVGVSQSTVSLVFSGKAAGRISARTEAAVRRPRPSWATGPTWRPARSRLGAARTIVLVVPDITNPFFGGLLRGAQTAARAAGYAVALIDTDNDRDWGAASAEALHAGPADGLLLFEVDPPRWAAGSEPIVVIESESRGHPSVRLDAERGTEAAVEPPARARAPADRPCRLRARPPDVQAAPPRGRPAGGGGRPARARGLRARRRPRRDARAAAPGTPSSPPCSATTT